MRDLLIEKSRARNWYELRKPIRDRLKAQLKEVAQTPKPTDHQKVQLMDGTRKTIYRLRSGSYRVIFTCSNGNLLVWKVGERRGIYDNINQTFGQVPA
jgi:mRNA-degrading endonuclease RelE of RelBE toxin-antitoxin system